VLRRCSTGHHVLAVRRNPLDGAQTTSCLPTSVSRRTDQHGLGTSIIFTAWRYLLLQRTIVSHTWHSVLGDIMSGNVFFNLIPSHSRWFLPISFLNPRFSLALFTFPLVIPNLFRSHSRTASSISSGNKWPVNLTMHRTVLLYKKNSTKSSTIHKQYQSNQCLMDIQSET